MKAISSYMKKSARLLLTAAAVCLASPSCDNAIYDFEGDCTVTYRLEFRYDKNMKWADAFRQEVRSVHLYAFGPDGKLVWQKSESGEVLADRGYAMELGLPAGDYRLIAWCGLENEDGSSASFSVPDAVIGETDIEDLRCTMIRRHDDFGASSSESLTPVFHGMTDVKLPELDDKGKITCTMDLTKNTNHVRVILQHLSGEEIDVNDFNFRIEEENGLMDYDNSLLPDEMISYLPYSTRGAQTNLGIDDYPEVGSGKSALDAPRGITSISAAVADLSIARLTEDRRTILTIDTDEGDIVARIPLTDYALMLKDGFGREMTDQEYLDRQDEYALTFFLDENKRWISTSIVINSWKIVLNDIDF